MGDLSSASTKESNRKEEVVSIVAHDRVRETSATHVGLDIVAGSEMSRRRILHKVPPYVQKNKEHIYDPVVLSLGPYHHGQPQCRQAEELKDEVLNIICGGKDKGFLRSKVQERLGEIRHFYGGLSKDEYGNEALAEMTLRDACSVISYN